MATLHCNFKQQNAPKEQFFAFIGYRKMQDLWSFQGLRPQDPHQGSALDPLGVPAVISNDLWSLHIVQRCNSLPTVLAIHGTTIFLRPVKYETHCVIVKIQILQREIVIKCSGKAWLRDLGLLPGPPLSGVADHLILFLVPGQRTWVSYVAPAQIQTDNIKST